MTTEQEHTPGPWVVKAPRILVGSGKEGDRLILAKDTKEHVAEVFQYRNDDHKDEATSIVNARLIAAAPEVAASHERLLKLAEEFSDAMSQPYPDYYAMACTVVKVRDAIAQASARAN